MVTIATPSQPPANPVQGYLMAPPPRAQGAGVTSYVAAPAVMPSMVPANDVGTPAAAATDYTKIGLSLAENGAWLGAKAIGAYAAPVAAVFSVAAANHNAVKSVTELLEQYRGVVAQRMGIAPEAVDEETLRAAVEAQPEAFAVIKQALEVIDREQSTRPVVSVAGGAAGVGAFAAGTAMAAPLGPLAPVAGMIAACAAPWCAEKAGGMIFGASDLDETAHASIKAMNEKWQAGQPVSPLEVFTLFVRMDPRFQQNIRDRTGKDFFAMSEGEQMQFMMQAETKLTQASAQIAYMLNTRQMQPAQLAGVNPRQLVGQEPVVIAGGTPQIVRAENDSPQRTTIASATTTAPAAVNTQTPRPVRGAFSEAVLAKRAANVNLPSQPGRSA
ncbi:MAG: hypothetical protein K2Q12_06225 [Rickettsiales bacterium]|nr:hypothetical protein [Rickettsiales bacterium]